MMRKNPAPLRRAAPTWDDFTLTPLQRMWLIALAVRFYFRP